MDGGVLREGRLPFDKLKFTAHGVLPLADPLADLVEQEARSLMVVNGPVTAAGHVLGHGCGHAGLDLLEEHVGERGEFGEGRTDAGSAGRAPDGTAFAGFEGVVGAGVLVSAFGGAPLSVAAAGAEHGWGVVHVGS
jgi:hypothetical protein